MSSDDPKRWQPDPALVLTVRTRALPISELSGPDRAWVVAALTVQGWTVSAIAERLRCSLRLVQDIKAEPMTKVALYALQLEDDLANERRLRRMEERLATQGVAHLERRIQQLTTQRDILLDQITRPSRSAR